MKLPKFLSKFDLANKLAIGLLTAVIILAIACCGLVFMLVFRHERIVLTPAAIDTRLEVGWKSANSEYYKGHGVSIAMLLGNITPKNAQWTADTLAVYLSPKVYAAVRNKILALAQDQNFQRANSFNYFTPENVLFEPSTTRVFVTGTITSSSHSRVLTGSALSDIQQVVYEFTFVMSEGRPVVVDFSSYMGRDPRTLKWYDAHPDRPNPFDKGLKTAVPEVEESAIRSLPQYDELDLPAQPVPISPSMEGGVSPVVPSPGATGVTEHLSGTPSSTSSPAPATPADGKAMDPSAANTFDGVLPAEDVQQPKESTTHLPPPQPLAPMDAPLVRIP